MNKDNDIPNRAKSINRKSVITDELRKQILQVRDTGKTNMFNIAAVQRIANDLELFELVCFLEEKKNRTAYWDFIINADKSGEA